MEQKPASDASFIKMKSLPVEGEEVQVSGESTGE